jgi:diadenosine tetraphosphate (Ap4A) HIT family hydrolase
VETNPFYQKKPEATTRRLVITQQQDCHYCQDPVIQQKGLDHPRKIAELEVSTAVLNAGWQLYRGVTALVLRQHATELYHLDPDTRQKFVEDANRVALDKTFRPFKMNYEILGNRTPHLHWWLTPRRLTDPDPARPIWVVPTPRCSSATMSTARWPRRFGGIFSPGVFS